MPEPLGDPPGGRVGWWLALEPVGEDRAAWSLIRVDDEPVTGPLDAGLTSGLGALRALAARLPPQQTARPDGDRLWGGPLASPETEREVAVELGQVLLPALLRSELLRTGRPDTGTPHTVTIACRGWLARVPWDALALDPAGEVRLLERARVLGGLSPTLSVGRDLRPTRRPRARPLRIVDPGPRISAQTPPLYPGGYPPSLDCDDVLEDDEDLLPDGAAYTASDFGATLREPDGWSRLLYLGHALAGTADTPAGAALVFSAAAAEDRLTAHAWLSTPAVWPMPARVALIACASDDSIHLEQSGLPVAAVNAGAELLTVTRWTLPTDTDPPHETGTTDLAVAVDTAHRQVDAVEPLRQWQSARLRAWREHGRRVDSPLLWASLVTYLVPADGDADD